MLRKFLNSLLGRTTPVPPPCAMIDESATLHPEATIRNLSYHKERIMVGKRSHIRGELLVFGESGELTIGEKCYVGQQSRIWAEKSVIIGNRVLISHMVDIHDTDGHPLDCSARRQDIDSVLYGEGRRPSHAIGCAPVVIEDDVWIALKATILKGVTIGRGAVVAAGSVVNKDVEPFTLVAGNPARFVRHLDQA